MSTHANSYEADDDFIKVVQKEDADFMEFPKEDDGTVLLRTIQTQFPDAIGIKYKGSSGAWRAVREVENALVAPKEGWGDTIYCLTFSETKKRKTDSANNEARETKYTKSSENLLEKDLAVIGLPYETTDADFKQYFEEKYGEVVQCQVKLDRDTGKSRGFGFIRFKDAEAAKEALNGDNYMNGRKVLVKEKKEKPMKMYVNGLPEGTTQEDLIEYFSQFGTVIDSHIPMPFRSFAFFTFSSSEDGRNCLQQEHTFRDTQLKVRIRREKEQDGARNGAGRGFGNRTESSYSGGYNPKYSHNPMNESRGYRERNSPHRERNSPPQSLPQGQNNKAAELKNMLFEFLANQN